MGVARRWRSSVGFLFDHRDNLGHDEHRLADVGVPGALHPYRGLGDVVQEVAHLVQGQKAIHHLELAGTPSRRVMFRKEKRRGGWEEWGAAGQRAEVSIFDILIFLFMRWKSNEAKGTPNVSTIKRNNESRRYASNLKAKSFNFKYHIALENTKY